MKNNSNNIGMKRVFSLETINTTNLHQNEPIDSSNLQTVMKEALKRRKRKKASLYSISSFDSELEENKKDVNLMETKKHRKDLENVNDKLYERSVCLEKLMDAIIANMVNKSSKKYANV